MKKIITIVLMLAICSGCSWQGHQHYENGVIKAKAWSMRCLWVSSGIEMYDETAYWKTGYIIESSKSDANSIKATGDVAGQIINGVVK
jgi:hypothetical protein